MNIYQFSETWLTSYVEQIQLWLVILIVSTFVTAYAIRYLVKNHKKVTRSENGITLSFALSFFMPFVTIWIGNHFYSVISLEKIPKADVILLGNERSNEELEQLDTYFKPGAENENVILNKYTSSYGGTILHVLSISPSNQHQHYLIVLNSPAEHDPNYDNSSVKTVKRRDLFYFVDQTVDYRWGIPLEAVRFGRQLPKKDENVWKEFTD